MMFESNGNDTHESLDGGSDENCWKVKVMMIESNGHGARKRNLWC
jgi:hypothetical protein